MKILICGKGGCGKSTIVTLLSKEMAERANKVLVRSKMTRRREIEVAPLEMN